jgi:GST-like protein
MAPDKPAYAINRYQREVERHYGIVDERLSQRPYMLGDTYTIVDMALWGWARRLPFVIDDKQAWTRYPNVQRLVAEIDARPAAQAALALTQKHAFKRDFDDEARHHLFPQNRPRDA